MFIRFSFIVDIKTQTYENKAGAIRKVEKRFKTKSSIDKEFDILLSSTYLKNNEHFSRKLATKKGRKRFRKSKNPNVDECVFKLFKQTLNNNIPLGELLIKVKAGEFGLKLEKHNFKASNGQLNNFKERNNICFKTISSESGYVNLQVTND